MAGAGLGRAYAVPEVEETSQGMRKQRVAFRCERESGFKGERRVEI